MCGRAHSGSDLPEFTAACGPAVVASPSCDEPATAVPFRTTVVHCADWVADAVERT
mgnify:CR=1 FL=1